jgi:hypothetical protein
MRIRFGTVQLLVFLCCVGGATLWPSTPTSGQQQPQDAIAVLFEGVPADLRSKVKTNFVRRDRVNDWLRENVNGKGKTIEIKVPVRVGGKRANDGSYALLANLGTAAKGFGGGTPFTGGKKGGGTGFALLTAPKINVLGDDWSLDLLVGDPDASLYVSNQFELNGVSAADAEKLVDLEQASIKGKVHEVRLASETLLRVVLDDAQMEGKRITPRKREPAKELTLPKKDAGKD